MKTCKSSIVAFASVLLISASTCVPAEATGSNPKPVPLMQALPLPGKEVSFQRDGMEIARYHAGLNVRRPFIYPVIGPSGRSLTRMGHPHDPEGHSHHYSVWISHNSVDGLSFWDDRSKGRIIHQRVEKLDDADDHTELVTWNHWINETNNAVLLIERRTTRLEPMAGGEWLMTFDIQLEPTRNTVTFEKTPFGLIGVRMAKTICVNDGGGTIRNSEGLEGEKDIFWKPAKWVDYSGPITPKAVEGITLFDHPSNTNHPSVFHVRSDGWMCASLTFNGPLAINLGSALMLRYGLYIHSGMPSTEQLHEKWNAFARTAAPERRVETRKRGK